MSYKKTNLNHTISSTLKNMIFVTYVMEKEKENDKERTK